MFRRKWCVFLTLIIKELNYNGKRGGYDESVGFQFALGPRQCLR